MPSQPSWIKYVPQILQTLESPAAPSLLDRPAVEVLFGLRRRQAIHLLRRFGGYKIGKTFLVPRETVVRFLRDPNLWSAAGEERGRFEQVRSALGEARQELQQRSIPIPARTEALRLDLSGLPAGIRLETAQLTVQFETPVDLLEKLFALSQALTNDYDTFERSWIAAGRTGGGP
jgi:hypothetical protein